MHENRRQDVLLITDEPELLRLSLSPDHLHTAVRREDALALLHQKSETLRAVVTTFRLQGWKIAPEVFRAAPHPPIDRYLLVPTDRDITREICKSLINDRLLPFETVPRVIEQVQALIRHLQSR